MDRSTRLSLAALLLVGFTVGTDFTGILLLVPAIENEFSADITTTQWVGAEPLCPDLRDVHGRRRPHRRSLRPPAGDHRGPRDLRGGVGRLRAGPDRGAPDRGRRAARSILSGYDAKTAETISRPVTDDFTDGVSVACWVALVTAVLGLLAVRAMQESKLHRALA